jgi:hypothetical protein
MLVFFPPCRSWRRPPLAPCADLMARGWGGPQGAAPHPACGSRALARAMAAHLGTVGCARAISRSPQAVLLLRGAASLSAPVRSRGGGGAAHGHHEHRPPAGQQRAEASQPTRRGRAKCRGAHRCSATPGGQHARAQVQAAPLVPQCGRRLADAPPCSLEQGVACAPHRPLHPGIAGAGSLRSHARPGLALAVLGLSASASLLAGRMVAEAEKRRGGAGPWARGLAARRAGGALALPRRFLGACAQAARGHQILAPRAPGESRERVTPAHTHHLATAGEGWEPGQGLGVGRLGGTPESPGDLAASLILAVNPGKVDCPAVGPSGLGPPLGHAVAVRFGGARRPQLGQVVLPGGRRAMGQALRACAHQRDAAPEESTSRPQRCRGARGLREPAAAEEDGEVPGVQAVVVGGAARQGGPRQGRPAAKRPSCVGPPGGEPVPRIEARDGDAARLPPGGERRQQRLGAGLHSAMAQKLAGRLQATDVQGPGRPVDAAGAWMRCGREAQEVSPSSAVLSSLPADHRGRWRRGPQ